MKPNPTSVDVLTAAPCTPLAGRSSPAPRSAGPGDSNRARLHYRRFRQALYFAILGLVVVVAWHYWSEFKSVLLQNPTTVAIMVLLNVLVLVAQSANVVLVLRAAQVDVRFDAIVRLWGIGGLLNYLAPLQAGTATRVMLLKDCGVPVPIALRTIFDLGKSLIWIALLLMTWPLAAYDSLIGLLYFAVFIAATALSEWLGAYTARWTGRIGELVNSVCTGVRALRHPATFALSFLVYLLGAVSLYFSFSSYGVTILPVQAFLLTGVLILVSTVNLVPGNFGIQELLIATVLGDAGTIGLVIGVSLLYRIVQLASLAITIALGEILRLGSAKRG